MHEYTAAHKTLPIPSVVEVTNVQNGRQLRLVVNDRGPFVGDRIIDLSKKASEELGTHSKGVAKVRVEALPEDSAKLAAYLKQYGRYGIDPSGRSWDVIYRDEIAGKPFAVQETAELSALPEVPQKPSVIETAYDDEQKHTPVKKTAPTVSLTGAASKKKDPFDLLLEEVSEQENPPIDIIQEEVGPVARSSSRSSKGQSKKALAPQKPIQKSSGRYVQVGSFVNKGNAQNLVSDLSKHGKAQVVRDNKQFYGVKLGPFPSEAQAKQVASRVAKEGHHGARIGS
jgi:rare lipoprotein A